MDKKLVLYFAFAHSNFSRMKLTYKVNYYIRKGANMVVKIRKYMQIPSLFLTLSTITLCCR